MATRLMTFKWCKENNDHAKKKPIPNSNQLMTSSKFSEYINSEQFNSEPSNKIITRYEVPEVLTNSVIRVRKIQWGSEYYYSLVFDNTNPVPVYSRNINTNQITSLGVITPGTSSDYNYPTWYRVYVNSDEVLEFSIDQTNWVAAWGLKFTNAAHGGIRAIKKLTEITNFRIIFKPFTLLNECELMGIKNSRTRIPWNGSNKVVDKNSAQVDTVLKLVGDNNVKYTFYSGAILERDIMYEYSDLSNIVTTGYYDYEFEREYINNEFNLSITQYRMNSPSSYPAYAGAHDYDGYNVQMTENDNTNITFFGIDSTTKSSRNKRFNGLVYEIRIDGRILDLYPNGTNYLRYKNDNVNAFELVNHTWVKI